MKEKVSNFKVKKLNKMLMTWRQNSSKKLENKENKNNNKSKVKNKNLKQQGNNF
jgi:hypothetical protein